MFPTNLRPLTITAPAALWLLVCAGVLRAQDTRNVTEPIFPPACSTLRAQLAIVDGEPSSETAFDTARIQDAMNACAPGKAVELASSGANHAFLIAPISIPNGVTLLVDAGVTVFASRNPADYQRPGKVETCGTLGPRGGGCQPLIISNGNHPSTGSGIMGYGIIDGRGVDKLLLKGKPGPDSWFDIGAQSYLPTPHLAQNNPMLIWVKRASNFTLYKITLRNGPLFQFKWDEDAKGLTVWGVKIVTPYTARNTDGIDPTNRVSDITITNSYISNGDDHVALSANRAGNSVSNVSITNLHTYSGRGISIGSGTDGGVSNVLVDHIDQAGNSADASGNGFRLKSAAGRGGLIRDVVFQNICQQNEAYAIRFDPFYVKNSSDAKIPTFENITVRNVTILPNTGGLRSDFRLQGHDAAHPTSLTLDNLNIGYAPDLKLAPKFLHITLGPGPVTPVSLQHLEGAGVTYTGRVTDPAKPPYPCSATNFPSLVGELFLSTDSATNLRTASLAAPATFTLNAVVEPAAAEYAAPAAPIAFFEGTKSVGAAKLGGNGTHAAVTLSAVPAGVHTYAARYPGDSNHPALSFGSVTVTVK
jgi:polygalacturonase